MYASIRPTFIKETSRMLRIAGRGPVKFVSSACHEASARRLCSNGYLRPLVHRRFVQELLNLAHLAPRILRHCMRAEVLAKIIDSPIVASSTAMYVVES